MKVTSTSIVRSESILEAIKVAITEQYNEKASAKHISNLSVDGLVGASVVTTEHSTFKLVNANYFIATELSAGLIRVEFCFNSESVDK